MAILSGLIGISKNVYLSGVFYTLLVACEGVNWSAPTKVSFFDFIFII